MARLLCIALLVSGCGRARLVDDPLPDAGAPADAASTDALRFDVSLPPLDAGTDPGAAMSSLLDALTCGMTQDNAIAAALRTANCGDSTFGATFEAYEAFLFARADFGLSRMPTGNCDYWRCVASSNNCADFGRCVEQHQCDGDVLPNCDGNVAILCPGSASGVGRRVDCTAFGATCGRTGCETPEGCSFLGSPDELQCDGDDITLCGGDLRFNCGDLRPGGCNSVAIQGEIPTDWCGPSVAAVYEGPSECVSPTRLRHVSPSGTIVEFECAEYGYEACGETGCF